MRTGDVVDEFEALDQDGKPVRLSQLLETGPIVLFFYPKAMTPGCTAESCHFRDVAADFDAAGAQRVGISADDVARQKAFDEKYDLGYALLSDPDRKIARQFGVKRLGFLPSKRATFVIDADATVLGVIQSELDMSSHADEALEILGRRTAG